MIVCSNCGQMVQDGYQQCPRCGALLMQQTINQQQVFQQNPYMNQQQFAPNMQMQQKPPKKKGKGCLIALAVCVFLFVIVPVVKGYNQRSQEVKQESKSSTAEEVSTKDTTSSSKDTTSSSESAEDFSYEITDTDFVYYQNSIGRTEYYGYVEILNTGKCNIYLKGCTFDLEDNDGHLLQSDSMMISSCPDVIAPGEKGYFYNNLGATSIDESVSLDNGIKLVPQYQIEKARGDIIEYDISDTDMRTDDYGKIKITGRITNNTDDDDSMVYVEFIYYDKDGKVLAINGTNVIDLTAGSTKSFEVTTLFSNEKVTAENVADYKVVARKSHYQW